MTVHQTIWQSLLGLTLAFWEWGKRLWGLMQHPWDLKQHLWGLI